MSKKRRKRCPSFHFLHFEIANEHFYCKTITHIIHMSCYTYKTIHFWLKYNDLANVRKTPKLIEGSHRDLQDYRHICYYLYVFFYVFNVFFSKSNVFCLSRTFSRTMRLLVDIFLSPEIRASCIPVTFFSHHDTPQLDYVLC